MVMCPNQLEKSVLHAICERELKDRDILNLQLQRINVKSRENTGAGFWTNLRVNPDSPPLDSDRVIGDVAAKIEGLKNPMIFVVFVRNGYLDQLEGAAVADSTVQIDFTHANFEILEERVQKIGDPSEENDNL
jgi:hypothetical protein